MNKEKLDQLIDEASIESFPASDSPAWVWGDDRLIINSATKDEQQELLHPINERPDKAPVLQPNIEEYNNKQSRDIDKDGLIKPERQEDG